MENTREGGLVKWQWSNYPRSHRDRRNLLVHIFTVPIFMAGTVLLCASPWRGVLSALTGLAAMIFAMAAQGRAHRLEENGPEPFLGPLDVVGRIFVEQWFTFPRYVATGRFLAAWKETR
jgi:hypothetical protein